MTDWRQQTIDTYNRSAKELAEYFKGIGPRVKDIDLAFQLVGMPQNARVLEIGCGDGRDAKDIVSKAGWYLGFDVSKELIKLAQKHVPEASFQVADATDFDYPENLDIVFAFASLLHLDKNEVKAVLRRVHASLNPGGVFYISLKERPSYSQEIKNDQYGSRKFYFYNLKVISELAGKDYAVVAHSQKTIGTTDWFEVALRKT